MLPDCHVGRGAAPQARGDRPRRAHSRRGWSSARTPSSTPSGSAAPESGICLITQAMIDRLGTDGAMQP